MLSIEKQVLYILSGLPSIESQELVSIFAARQCSPQSIRNVLSRLKKDNYVVSPARSSYSITDKGRAFIQTINQKPLLYKETWDGSWYVVLLEVPETERRKRDLMRNDLIQIGFGCLYKSVYITPWNFTEKINQWSHSYQIDNLTLFKGKFLMSEITPEKVERIWQLDVLNELYQQKWAWAQQEFMPSVENHLTKDPDPLQIFAYFLLLGDVINQLLLKDPMLPKEIRPKNWQGETILNALVSYNYKLAAKIPTDSYYSHFIN
jgi:phenylacetic acid degradation operon negative regulatory protein